MRKIIGQVTKEEAQEIHYLFTRKRIAEETLQSPPGPFKTPEFEATFIHSLSQIKMDYDTSFQMWWDKILNRENLEHYKEVNVDFFSGELYIDE